MYTDTAKDIVDELLEAEDPDFDAEEYMAPIPDPIDQGLQKMGYVRTNEPHAPNRFWEKPLAEPRPGSRYTLFFSPIMSLGEEMPGEMLVSVDKYVPLAGWTCAWDSTLPTNIVLQAAPALESGAKTAIDMDMDGVDFNEAMHALLNTFR
jgi:hypothetical protein